MNPVDPHVNPRFRLPVWGGLGRAGPGVKVQRQLLLLLPGQNRLPLRLDDLPQQFIAELQLPHAFQIGRGPRKRTRVDPDPPAHLTHRQRHALMRHVQKIIHRRFCPAGRFFVTPPLHLRSSAAGQDRAGGHPVPHPLYRGEKPRCFPWLRPSSAMPFHRPFVGTPPAHPGWQRSSEASIQCPSGPPHVDRLDHLGPSCFSNSARIRRINSSRSTCDCRSMAAPYLAPPVPKTLLCQDDRRIGRPVPFALPSLLAFWSGTH